MHQQFKFCPQCKSDMAGTVIENEPRHACTNDACDFVQYENPTPVVAAIVEHEGDIILAHNKMWTQKFFGVITGFLEKHEVPEPAMIREVKEELGLDAHSPTLIGHYQFEPMNQIIIAYHVHAEGEIVLGDELDEYKRISPDKLKGWPMGAGKAVTDWVNQRNADISATE